MSLFSDNINLIQNYNYKQLFKPYDKQINIVSGVGDLNINLENNNYDKNINAQHNMLKKAFSLQKEINITDMAIILNLINTHYKIFTLNAKSLINYYKSNNKINDLAVAYHILFQINKVILDNQLSNEKHIFSFFKLNDVIILNNNAKNIKGVIRINREYKIMNFTIEFDLNINLNNNTLLLNYNYIKLQGINNDYKFDDYKKYYQKLEIPIDTNQDIINYDRLYSESDRIEEGTVLFSNSEKYNIEYARKSVLYPDHNCFILDPDKKEVITLDTDNPIKCKSYWKDYGYNGVWDSICKKNEDCPFYDKDIDRGKCNLNSGICEMPEGVTRIGYKQYLKTSKPECANCSFNDPYCCYSDKINYSLDSINDKLKFI